MKRICIFSSTFVISLLSLSQKALAAQQTSTEDTELSFGTILLIALGVGLVIATIVLLVLRSKMKTARFQRGAGSYLRPGSYRLTNNGNYYLYSTVTKIPRPQNNSSGRRRR